MDNLFPNCGFFAFSAGDCLGNAECKIWRGGGGCSAPGRRYSRSAASTFMAFVRADAASVGLSLYDCKSCAGEMLRLAGYRPAGGRRARGSRRRGVGGKTPPASLSHLPFQERQSVRLTGREPPMKGEVSPQATEGLSPCRGVYVARKKHSAA